MPASFLASLKFSVLALAEVFTRIWQCSVAQTSDKIACKMRFTTFLLTMSAIAGLAAAQDSRTDAGAGWAPEFKMAGRQIFQLAEAIPAEKYGWRPGAGVRSVSEVLMHTASGNYFFLQSMGVKAGEDLPKDPGKSVTAKADVVRWLKASFEAVQENYPKIDKQKTVKFLGHDATCEGVLLRALAHANEHLGQMIAYARVNGIVPPWSK